MKIGIDYGSTTTKIVVMDNDSIIFSSRIGKNEDYKKVFEELELSDVEKIGITGGGASFIEENIFGIETVHVGEFDALGRGARLLTGVDDCIVTSIGTGTSIAYMNGENVTYESGTGLGGATICALAEMCLGITEVDKIFDLASHGALNEADLMIGDISKVDIGSLYSEATAANLGKLNKNSKPENIAFGICNLVFQNVGVMAAMVDKNHHTGKNIVLGSVGQSEVAEVIFEMIDKFFGIKTIIPKDSVYAGAIGAALLS